MFETEREREETRGQERYLEMEKKDHRHRRDKDKAMGDDGCVYVCRGLWVGEGRGERGLSLTHDATSFAAPHLTGRQGPLLGRHLMKIKVGSFMLSPAN